MSITTAVNSPVLLVLAIEDRETVLYPRVTILDDTGAVESGPIDMAATTSLYTFHAAWTPTSAGKFSAVYDVYSDAGHTTLANYSAEAVSVRVGEELDAADAVWDEPLDEHIIAGSAGESLIVAGAQGGVSVRVDAIAWDVNDRPTQFRVRIFSDASTAAASTPLGTGEGEILTFEDDATHVNAVRWQSLLRRRV